MRWYEIEEASVDRDGSACWDRGWYWEEKIEAASATSAAKKAVASLDRDLYDPDRFGATWDFRATGRDGMAVARVKYRAGGREERPEIMSVTSERFAP